MYTYINIHIHMITYTTNMCTYIYIYTHIHTYIYTCTYTHTYIARDLGHDAEVAHVGHDLLLRFSGPGGLRGSLPIKGYRSGAPTRRNKNTNKCYNKQNISFSKNLKTGFAEWRKPYP